MARPFVISRVLHRRPLVFLTELRNFSPLGRGGLRFPCSISVHAAISRVQFQKNEVRLEMESIFKKRIPVTSMDTVSGHKESID